MTTQKYYKVVSCQAKRFFSSYATDDWQIEYFIDKWVHPIKENTELFVFSDLEKAKRYSGEYDNGTTVFECDVKSPIEIKVNPFHFSANCQYDAFWRYELNVGIAPKNFLVNEDSGVTKIVRCKAVKLIKEIK